MIVQNVFKHKKNVSYQKNTTYSVINYLHITIIDVTILYDL